MSYPVHQTAWLATALGLTAEQLQGDPNWQLLAQALLGPVQDVEDMLIGMLEGRELNFAVGQTLDNIGTVVGQPRNGQVDATYRIFLAVRIALNRSSGTIPDIIKIFALLGSTQTVVTEFQPMGITVAPNFPIPNAAATAAQYAAILGQARMGAVAAHLISSSDVDANMLWVSDASVSYALSQSTGLGLGLSDTANPTTGGQLASAALGV